MGSVRPHGSSSLGQAQVTFRSNILTWSPFVDGILESSESLVFPAAFLWGITEQGHRWALKASSSPGEPAFPLAQGLAVQRGSSAGGGVRQEERLGGSRGSAQSLLVPGPGSSFWQQHEEGGLQEAAEAAESSHKPMGVEARVAADHTLEDIGLQGKRDS